LFIELVDDLRCPRPHEETWLVASVDRTRDRDIVAGTLGCPVCRAEYPIRDGAVWFDDATPAVPGASVEPDAQLAMRIAAFLDLSEANGFAVLAGSYAPLAERLRGVIPTHVIALNAPRPVRTGEGISALIIHAGIPLANATCRGVALDSAHSDPARLDAAVRVLQPRGRLVAPATTALPDGVTELARDEDLWVAERTAAPSEPHELRGRGG
jgi:uncharacterized protein YbaR (Trm112 family)